MRLLEQAGQRCERRARREVPRILQKFDVSIKVEDVCAARYVVVVHAARDARGDGVPRNRNFALSRCACSGVVDVGDGEALDSFP